MVTSIFSHFLLFILQTNTLRSWLAVIIFSSTDQSISETIWVCSEIYCRISQVLMSLKVLISKMNTLVFFFVAMAQKAPFLEKARAEIPFSQSRSILVILDIWIFMFFYCIIKGFSNFVSDIFQKTKNKSLCMRKHQRQEQSIQGNSTFGDDNQESLQFRNYVKQNNKKNDFFSKNKSEFQKQKQDHNVHKSTELKEPNSFEKISIKSPLKNIPSNSKTKYYSEKSNISQTKNGEKNRNENIKDITQSEQNNINKSIKQSHMKSTIKSNHKVKKINKQFYQETFYITGMKENYLLLLNDNNQVLQFPVGMFTTQGGSNEDGEQSNKQIHENTEQFQLIKDIKIGQAVKIKLEFDYLRQQKDDRIFNSLQRTIHEQYCQKDDSVKQIRDRERMSP